MYMYIIIMVYYTLAVFTTLSKTAEAVLYYDPPLIVLTWKVLGKMACRVKSILTSEACSAVRDMCSVMLKKTSECVACASQGKKVSTCTRTCTLPSLLVGCVCCCRIHRASLLNC